MGCCTSTSRRDPREKTVRRLRKKPSEVVKVQDWVGQSN